MKVLYLINFAGKSGTERYVENLVAHLHPGKAECGLCYGIDGPLAEKMRSKKLPVHQVPMRHLFDLAAARAIANICREGGYDVIHAQYPRENYIAILSRLFGCRAKVVFTSHLTLRQPIHWRLLNRLFTPQNHRVIAVCSESRQLLVDNGVAKDKIQVVFNGIDAARIPPRDRSVLAPFCIGDEPVLSILARFMPEKGLDFLCQAIARLKEKYPHPFRVLVMGDGDGFQEIQALISRLGLGDTILLAGFRSDSIQLLAASDLYLNTSSCNEAMSFAILEALGCGLPVVATDVGGNAELVHTGSDCGFIVPYGDADAFAETLARLLEDGALHRQFSAAARAKACREFDLGHLLDCIFEIYQ